QEAAADAHDGADEADQEADTPDRNGRDVDLGLLEPQLERQAVDPGMAAAAPDFRRPAMPGADDRPGALDDRQRAHRPEPNEVREADGEVELPDRAEQREQPDAGGGSENAPREQHQRERGIKPAPAPVGDGAGER